MTTEARSRSLEEKLVDQFYDWELCGRGWTAYSRPVAPEPPFRQFYGHFVEAEEAVDDGRTPTFLSGLYARLVGGGPPAPALPEPEEEPEPEYLDEPEERVEIQIALPQDLQIAKETFEQFLSSLPYRGEPVGFEIIGTPDAITALFTVPAHEAAQLQLQLNAHFPEAIFCRTDGLLSKAWSAEDGQGVIAEFGLSEEFMIPLAVLRADPFVGIAGTLAELSEGERGVFQVLFQPVRHPWAEGILNAVTDNAGGPFFVDNPDLFAQAKAKIGKPLYAAVVRIAAKAQTEGRAWQVAQSLTAVLRLLSSPTGNSLIPLDNECYDPPDHESDLLSRRCRRSGMILNSDELLAFVHLPGSAVRSQKLARQVKRTKAAPGIATCATGLILGENDHAGKTKTVRLSPDQRVQHAHILGASGTGKSTLLFNLILQDIQNGQGIAVMDPHGDLIEHILGHIPEDRIKDVILFDASDEEFPIGFNILDAHTSLEKNLLASDLVSVFRRLSTSWGDQMNSVLGNAILAFLESEQGGTLIDLRRFLIEAEFRSEFLKTVTDSEVVYFWKKEFPLITGRPHISLLTRLNTFLRPKPIRFMVGQKANRLDFADIMNSGKIFLAKLPQGQIGQENAYLLGTLLVSKFQQLVIARQAMKESLRRDFTLCIDECHHFLTPSMATILTGARKYRLGLFLAHQELHQLDKDPDVGSAVRGNPYTRIYFRVGTEDARKIAEGLSFFESKDLQNLERGEAICRIERSDCDFNLNVHPPARRDSAECDRMRERVIAASRSAYGTPRALIEKLLQPREEEVPVTPPVPKPTAKPVVPEPAVQTPNPEPKPAEPNPPVPVKKDIPAVPAVMGRGGKEHQYLQHLIKQLAIGLNFEVDVEKEILGGAGSVDVLVKKGGKSFAFEISVTTSVEHEVENIQKCFKADCQEVIVVCLEEAKLVKIRLAAAAALAKDCERVSFCLPNDLGGKLMDISTQCRGTDSVVHGRRTKVKYSRVSAEEAQERREALAKVTAQSLKKLKKKS